MISRSAGQFVDCRSAGYTVKTYGSAREFLDAEPEGRTAMALVDVKMEGMTGFDLQEELTARHSAIPLIFITDFDDAATRERIRRTGSRCRRRFFRDRQSEWSSARYLTSPAPARPPPSHRLPGLASALVVLVGGCRDESAGNENIQGPLHPRRGDLLPALEQLPIRAAPSLALALNFEVAVSSSHSEIHARSAVMKSSGGWLMRHRLNQLWPSRAACARTS